MNETTSDNFMHAVCDLGKLIETHLRPDVVRIDTEGFYPEGFLRRFGAAGGFALHVISPDRMPEAIDAMTQVGRVLRLNRISGLVSRRLPLVFGRYGEPRAARTLSPADRYLPDRPDSLQRELTCLRAEAATLASTSLDPSARYSAAVMELRLQTAELALRAAQSALLHSGAKGFITTCAPQRRMREAMFFAILTPSIKHLRKELTKLAPARFAATATESAR